MRGFLVTAAAFGAALVATPSASAGTPAVERALRAADAPAAQLDATSTRTLPSGAVVSRFAQEVGGVPVAGSGAVVLDAFDSPPELLFDKTRTGLSAPGEPELSRTQAIDAAGNAVGLRILRGDPTARLVIVPGDEGALAWEVLIPAAAPLGDFLVTVDAVTGETVSEGNLIRRATGSARLFSPNPVVENNGYSGLKDRDDRDSALLTSLRDPVTLENIKNGQSCLKGLYAVVTESDKEKKVCKDSLDWSAVTRKRDKFEALMAYFHVDGVQQYIQTLDLPPINEESQNAVANPRMPPQLGQDNSFYSPGVDEIRFGRGGVDDAEDAEIIVHEYGHAVQDDQNSDAYFAAGNQPGAQGEGFGDYLADAYGTEVAGFDPEWSSCVGEWDATSYDDDTPSSPGICLRRNDNENTWDEQKGECGGGSEIHCVGEAWSSALFDLRIALGDDAGGDSVMDKVVLASHFLAPPAVTFAEASQALIEADESEYAGIHCVAIEAELEDRGFFSGNPCP